MDLNLSMCVCALAQGRRFYAMALEAFSALIVAPLGREGWVLNSCDESDCTQHKYVCCVLVTSTSKLLADFLYVADVVCAIWNYLLQ